MSYHLCFYQTNGVYGNWMSLVPCVNMTGPSMLDLTSLMV